MRIMTLAAGLATGYVLGARAGREKYDQITAVARKVSARPGTAQADLYGAGHQPDADSIVRPTAAPSIEPSTIEPSTTVDAADKPRRPRNRRTKARTETGTPSVLDESPAMRTANLGLDGDLPWETAEADVVEQNMPVVDNSQESALIPTPLESDPADVREQRRPL